MAINTNISNWIDRAEPDYYTMFIKAWIPYNAWYMQNFYDEDASPKRTTDKEIIEYIKTNSNKYKDRIISLFRNTDEESISFKSWIANLHYELEAHVIPNADEKIGFTSICIEDNISQKLIQKRYKSYKCVKDISLPKTSPRIILEVINNNSSSTVNRICLHKFSIKELKNNQNYKDIQNETDKKELENCLNENNPKKRISIVLPPKTRGEKSVAPNNSIVIDKNKYLYFRENYEDVSKCIIQIIYELRCKLFHGEIEPTNTCMKIFQYAFNIQKLLIKELQ